MSQEENINAARVIVTGLLKGSPFSPLNDQYSSPLMTNISHFNDKNPLFINETYLHTYILLLLMSMYFKMIPGPASLFFSQK